MSLKNHTRLEIIEAFKKFFENRGYRFVLNNNVLPPKNSDLLFVSAGIVNMIDTLKEKEDQ
jgi:alanyl-tRNA synthetase